MTLLPNVAHSTKWSAMMKLIAASLGFVLASSAWAQLLEQLPRRACSQKAAEVAKERDVVFSPDTKFIFNYESHYNSRLKKCFLLEITTMIDRDGETRA